MENQIRKLLDRYYACETSIDEENELKRLLAHADGFEEEKLFFLGIGELSAEEPIKKPSPRAVKGLAVWQKVAAIAIVFVALGWLFMEQQRRMQEEEAYDKVIEAMALIQKNMQKGTSSLHTMENIKYLNTTNELFNINRQVTKEQE